MKHFIENLGDVTIKSSISFYETVAFSIICLIHMFNPKSYNPAMRTVLTKQIYFTAIGALPLFMMMAMIFGTSIIGVIISLAKEYNLQDQIGAIIITFAIDEFSPFISALLVSLRSASAVNAEISLMKVNKELNTLERYGIDLINYLFIPRIISGMISIITLSILFSIIMVSSGYLFVQFYINMDLISYKNLLLNAVEISDFIILLVKAAFFGFTIMVIQILSGIQTEDTYSSIPISVSKGMVRLFIALFIIEAISLSLQLI